MTLHLGNVPAGSTIYVPFATYNAAGASVTLSGLIAGDIEIFKNGSVTQRSSDNGYTLLDTDGIDFDGITGIHGFSVDLSDNTDASFYAVGSFYWVVVASVTADSQTVNFIAATFRIVAAEHTAGYPVITIKDGTGTGEIDTTSGGVLVAAIAANAITATAIASDAITDAKVASDVTIASVTGAVGSVTGNVSGSVASIASGGITATSFAADSITAAKLHSDVTTELQSGLATASALSTVAGYLDTEVAAILAAVDTEVGTIITNLATAQTAIDAIPTNAELATALGTADDAVLAQVALVKTQTDQLTFTVTGSVDANTTHVNDVEVAGDGDGTPWGPA